MRVIAVIALLLTGCTDQVLQALEPDFALSWSTDQGFVEGALADSSLRFGDVQTGDFGTITLNYRNPGNAPLEICGVYLAELTLGPDGHVVNELRVDADPELLAVPLPAPGPLSRQATGQFQLRYIPLQEGSLGDGLHLVVKHELNWDCDTNLGDGLHIPIVGAGLGGPVPDIYSKPDFVDFGTNPLNTGIPPEPVLVGNAGPGTLNVGSVFLDDPTHFGLIPGDVQGGAFEQGDSALATLFFNPQSAGEHTTDLVITSNDPDESPLRIPLVGVAEDIPIDDPPPGDDDDATAPPPSGAPVAMCGSTIFATTGETVTLEQFSFHTGGFAQTLSLQYAWTLSVPTGSAVTLNGASTGSPTTTALDLVGLYVGALVVTDSAGVTDSCTQDIQVLPPENFKVELLWNAEDDLDLHILEANDGTGTAGDPWTDGDCYFANCVGLGLDWGVSGDIYDNPYLDNDDIGGTGPENTNITDPAVAPYDGWYQVMVHDYTGSTDDNYGDTDATVHIYLNQVLTQSYSFTMSGDGDEYWVAKIAWPSGQVVPCNGLGGCP